MQQKKYILSGNATIFCPVIPYFGLLWYNIDNSVSIPMDYPLGGKWGQVLSDNIPLVDTFPLPFCISSCWLSLFEERFFICEKPLNQFILEDRYALLTQADDSDVYFVMGFGANGLLALWLQNKKKCYLIDCFQGEECFIPMSDFMPVQPDLTVHQLCELIKNDYSYNNSQDNEVLKNKFIKMMRRYTYKYIVTFKIFNDKWYELPEGEIQPNFCWINEALFDGTFDKLHNDILFKYHNAAKPEKIAINWSIGKTEYLAYFWMDETQLNIIFERFYGAHPETKADFIIRIDAENKKYELALFRQGLKEPLIIPEAAYQLIVFKNNFEDYRSENYNQPRGAWIW